MRTRSRQRVQDIVTGRVGTVNDIVTRYEGYQDVAFVSWDGDDEEDLLPVVRLRKPEFVPGNCFTQE